MSDEFRIDIDIEFTDDGVLEFELEDSEESIDSDMSDVMQVVTSDYTQLRNLPTFNGSTIIGAVVESDPTVPDWSKEPCKPNYTCEEVGALGKDSEMSYSDIKSMWDSFFNK